MGFMGLFFDHNLVRQTHTHTYRHSLREPRLYMPPDQTSLQELLNRFRGSPCFFLSTFSFQGPRADQMAGHVLRVNGAFLC